MEKSIKEKMILKNKDYDWKMPGKQLSNWMRRQ
jgi:hypothetical protein